MTEKNTGRVTMKRITKERERELELLLMRLMLQTEKRAMLARGVINVFQFSPTITEEEVQEWVSCCMDLGEHKGVLNTVKQILKVMCPEKLHSMLEGFEGGGCNGKQCP